MRLPLAALIGVFALPAFAQSQYFEVDKAVDVARFEMKADQVDEFDVHDTSGRKIGEIEEVVGSNRAMADSLVVDFEDSLTEYGDEDRVIPLEEFDFDGEVMTLSDDVDVTRMSTWID